METVKKIIKKIVENNTIILGLYIIVIELLFKVLVNTISFDYSILRIIISSFIISYIVNLIKNIKVKKVISTLVAVIVTGYSFAQLGFNNFLGSYMSLNASSQLGKVTDYISDYFASFKFSYYLIFIPLILYIIYVVIIKEMGDSRKKSTLIVIPVLILFYYFTITLGFMQNKYQYVSNLDLFRNPSISTVAVNQFGVNVYGLLDVKAKFIKNDVDADNIDIDIEVEVETDVDNEIREEENKFFEYLINKETDNNYNTLNKYFYSAASLENNEYTGMFEGKNVIVVLMESVGELMYNEEYFPTLYKLYNEGITFTNNYSPRTSCSTGNNEFSTLTSLFAISNTCTSNIHKNNTYLNSIFNLFNNAGYTTSAFHDYDEKYYFRSTFIVNMGANFYKDVNDLGIKYNKEYKEWPSDVELINKAYPEFTTLNEGTTNFMTYLVSVTTHQPYGVSSEFGDKYLKVFADLNVSVSVKRYLSKMMEFDKAMEQLLANLENDGILDDTVIVLFGDHYPYGLKTSELQKMFDYDISVNNEIERTPFIIYNSATPGLKVDTYTTYMDILPTVANLFNLHSNSRYYMGEDALGPNYSGIAMFPDGSWQSKYAFYDAETSKINYINEDYVYTSEEINNINDTINKKITMSNLAITKNYFEYLEEEREEYNNPNKETTDNEETNSTSEEIN